MDSLLFHPKVVHLPVALGVLMPLVAAGLLVAWRRKWLPARSWLVAVALQAALFGSGLVAMQTGQAQEERVESIVAERFIEHHEEAAEAFVWAAGGVLGLMLLAAVYRNRAAGAGLALAATLGTVVVFGLGYRTGEAGGALVYEHGAARAYAGGASGSPVAQTEMAQPTDDDHD